MLSILLLGSTLAAATPVAETRDVHQQVIAAYQAGDGETMSRHATRLLELRPGSPRYLYFAAAGAALAGDAASALAYLERMAAMGLGLQIEHEPALASLHELEPFQRILERMVANREPHGTAASTFRLDDGHYIPEAVAYDPVQDRFFIGSVRQRRIDRLTATGIEPFVAAGSQGLMSVMGIKAVASERRLYVATTGGSEAPGTPMELRGRSGIFIHDLDSGALVDKHLLPAGREHWLGDLLPVGERVYATDSVTGEVFCLVIGTGQWHTLVAAGTLASPQGLALNAAGDALYIADYSGGIWHLQLAGGELTRLPTPEDLNVYGIDGLYRHGQWLIAIQNGFPPHRVARFRLAADGRAITAGESLVAAHPDFDDPTLGVIVGERFHFVANSHWPRFDAEKNLPPAAELSGPVVLTLDLSRYDW